MSIPTIKNTMHCMEMGRGTVIGHGMEMCDGMEMWDGMEIGNL